MYNFLTILIAIIALFLSYLSYDLSTNQTKNNKLLLLKASTESSHLNLKFSVIDSNKFFSMGEAYLPSKILKNVIPILQDGTLLYTSSIEGILQSLILEKFPPEKGFAKITNMNIPIMIKSHYIYNGNSYTDNSVYIISLMASIEENKQPSIIFKGLVFLKRLDPKIVYTQKYIDDLLEKKDTYIMPSDTF